MYQLRKVLASKYRINLTATIQLTSHTVLCAIVARVESQQWHHGEVRPASLPVAPQVQSDPSLASRCHQSVRGMQMVAVASLVGAQPTPVW